MIRRRYIVMGSRIEFKETGEQGEVVGLKFAPKFPYSLRQVQVRWSGRRTTTWVKTQEVV